MAIIDSTKIPKSPLKEYSTGGILSPALYSYSSQVRSVLAMSKDDLLNNVSLNVYDDMLLDPELYKCYNLIKIGVLADGIEFVPAVSDKHPDYKKAKYMADFCHVAFKKLARPLRVIIEEMLEALKYGHKIAEITYEHVNFANYGLKLVPVKIKPKPMGYLSFIVDDKDNILGFTETHILNNVQLEDTPDTVKEKTFELKRKGDSYYIIVDGVENEFRELDKYLYLTINPKDGDPRGNSIFRVAYNSWYLKQQVFPEYMRFILLCSSPLLVGILPENEEGEPMIDAQGNPILDEAGRPRMTNPVQVMKEALIDARSNSALALKGGSEIKEIGGQGIGASFYKAIDTYNAEMEMSILMQTLATSESRYNTRAASQTHMSVLDQVIAWYKTYVSDMIYKQLLTPLIKYNFGEEYLDFVPSVSLGDTERRNWKEDADGIANLYKVGFLDEEQKKEADAMLGFTPRQGSSTEDLTAEEQLNLAKTLLEHMKLKVEIARTKQAANSQRIVQLVQLKSLVESTVIKTKLPDGTTEDSISNNELIKGKLNLIDKLMLDLLENAISDEAGSLDLDIEETLNSLKPTIENLIKKPEPEIIDDNVL